MLNLREWKSKVTGRIGEQGQGAVSTSVQS